MLNLLLIRSCISPEKGGSVSGREQERPRRAKDSKISSSRGTRGRRGLWACPSLLGNHLKPPVAFSSVAHHYVITPEIQGFEATFAGDKNYRTPGVARGETARSRGTKGRRGTRIQTSCRHWGYIPLRLSCPFQTAFLPSSPEPVRRCRVGAKPLRW